MAATGSLPLAMKPVFIHVSKNGGTSVVRSAGAHIVSAGHRTAASWITEHGRSGPLFAVVRDPYDRVVSEYAYRRRRLHSGERNAHLPSAEAPFDRWVMSTFLGGQFRTQEFFDRTGTPHESANMVDGNLIWFVPQTKWLCDDNKQLLVDKVLRFEKLDEDWAQFSHAHGFECPLVHANASPRSAELRAELDPRVKGIIYHHYRDDFEVFGYPQ